MSYTVVDGLGRYKGDLCTIKGIEELENVAGEALSEFLDTGEADDALAEEIRNEVSENLDLKYIERLFDGNGPFVLNGGIEFEDDDE